MYVVVTERDGVRETDTLKDGVNVVETVRDVVPDSEPVAVELGDTETDGENDVVEDTLTDVDPEYVRLTVVVEVYVGEGLAVLVTEKLVVVERVVVREGVADGVTVSVMVSDSVPDGDDDAVIVVDVLYDWVSEELSDGLSDGVSVGLGDGDGSFPSWPRTARAHTRNSKIMRYRMLARSAGGALRWHTAVARRGLRGGSLLPQRSEKKRRSSRRGPPWANTGADCPFAVLPTEENVSMD